MPGLDTAIAPRKWRVVAILTVFLVAVALAGCSDDDGGGDAVDPPLDPEEVATSEVVIEGLAFAPDAITVEAGNETQWTNSDFTDPASASTSTNSPPAATEHTVTSDDGSTFDSGPLTGDATFSFTFLEPGTYAYHCSIHSSMTGTVNVT